jgi:hypothetical protein
MRTRELVLVEYYCGGVTTDLFLRCAFPTAGVSTRSRRLALNTSVVLSLSGDLALSLSLVWGRGRAIAYHLPYVSSNRCST